MNRTHAFIAVLLATSLLACSKTPAPPPQAPPAAPAAEPEAPRASQSLDLPAAVPAAVTPLAFEANRVIPAAQPGDIATAHLDALKTSNPAVNVLIDRWIARSCPVGPDVPKPETPQACLDQLLAQCVPAEGQRPAEGGVHCLYQGSVRVIAVLPGLLSLLYEGVFDFGGAHPITHTAGLLVDTARARRVSLDELLVDPYGAVPLRADAALRKLHGLKPDQSLKDAGFFEDHVGLASTWLLTPQGLHLVYAPYEVAPYSMGRPQVLLPFAELGEILAPRSPIASLVPPAP